MTCLGVGQEFGDGEAMLGKELKWWELRRRGAPQILGLRSCPVTTEKRW